MGNKTFTLNEANELLPQLKEDLLQAAAINGAV